MARADAADKVGGAVDPYPGGGPSEEDEQAGDAIGGDDDDDGDAAVFGPYPGGDGNDDDAAVVGPYPGGDDDYDDAAVVGPYPGGDGDDGDEVTAHPSTLGGGGDAFPNTQYPDEAAGRSAATEHEASTFTGPPPRRWRPPDWSKLPVMHRPRLEAFEGGRMVRSMMLTSQPTYIIGRDGAQADVVVMDATVSRQHAVIINSSSATFIQDLDSAHGTWYDESGRTLHVPRLGVKVGEDSVKLLEGSSLRFGSLKSTIFRVTGLEPQKVEKWQPPAWADVPARDCSLEVRSNTVSNPYLAHLDAGGDVEEVLPLRTRCTSFGRSAQHVDYVVKDDSVSRQHAAVVHSPDGESYLLDLNSSSGTYVEGRRVSEQIKLSDGIAFSLGTCKMTFTYRMAAPSGGKRKR